MKEIKKTVAAIDLGSSKVLVVVAEVYKDGTFRVLGQGRADSRAVANGIVGDVPEAQMAVKAALDEASQIAGTAKVAEVATNVSAKSVRGVDSRSEMPIKGRYVTLEDMASVQKMAKDAVDMRDDEVQVKSELLYYTIDGQLEGTGSLNPEGIQCSRIAAYMHSAVAGHLSTTNRMKTLIRAGVTPEIYIPEGWASGYAALTEDERQNGVLLIDVGAGTTDVVVFLNDKPRYTKTYQFGGELITKKIAGFLHCTNFEAEALKPRLDLRCLPEHKGVILFKTPIEEGGRKFSKYDISQVAVGELTTLIDAIGRDLFHKGWFDVDDQGNPYNKLPGGIVVTGGTALLIGITEMFDVPGAKAYTFSARLGRSRYSGDACIGLNSPKESAVMGMISYMAKRFQEGDEEESTATDDSLVNRMKRFAKEFFTGQY